ncbi:uncharacterized protein cdhr5b [Polymixia lowei]
MGKTADLTAVQKAIIDTLKQEGKTQKEISERIGCSQSAVSRHLSGKSVGRKKCGRKRCTTRRGDRTLRRIVEKGRFQTLGDLRKQWTESGVETSRATVHRRVQEMGYRCRIPQVKPLLNQKQRQKRLTWATEKQHWTVAQWSKHNMRSFMSRLGQIVLLSAMLVHITASLPPRERDEDDLEELMRREISNLNTKELFSRNYADALIEARLSQMRGVGLERRQLGDIEFSNRYAEYLRSKAKQSSICAFLRRMQTVKKRSAQAQQICASEDQEIFENNRVGEVVTNITIQEGVTLSFQPTGNPDNLFEIRGNQLLAAGVLDRESKAVHTVLIKCTQTATGTEFNLVIVVVVLNVNDNPPVFEQSQYHLNVNEFLPVGRVVGRYAAKDLDSTTLYYTLLSEPEGFNMQATTSPNIVVQKTLDYDTVKNVKLTLYAQDTPNPPPEGQPSFTASTTILVTILDVDNRPPWLQPCTRFNVGGVTVCQAPVYTGSVVLTEQQVGPLVLKPGPLYAIDGDSGINEEMTYSFLSGNDAGLFEINPNSGNITMTKPADVSGPINLTVMAAQKTNSFQFATTKVTIKVLTKSVNPPEFEKTQYDCFVTGVGSLALDPNNNNVPLRIQARDKDFAGSGGVNPAIIYNILGSSNFSLIDGYLFMMKDNPLGMVSLQVEAVDTSTGESVRAELAVEVSSGGMIVQSGGYGPEDMAALGASLAVLLFICAVVIGLLVYRIQTSKGDWRKISEASIFRSYLGKGSDGKKDGLQYTNESFQNDEDSDSMGYSSPEVMKVNMAIEPETKERNVPREEAILKSTAPLHTLLMPDNTSLAGSDKADSEKEVKPILTKERRVDEGYKSVWFKEDIDPNAKEEVVIIPDSGDQDGEEEDEENDSRRSKSKVLFADADIDSGLGVRIQEPASDSEEDEEL